MVKKINKCHAEDVRVRKKRPEVKVRKQSRYEIMIAYMIINGRGNSKERQSVRTQWQTRHKEKELIRTIYAKA